MVVRLEETARARVDFDPPGYNLPYDMWTRLVTAHQALLTVREDLEAATEGIAACPAEPSPSRYPDLMPVLRTRELLHDVIGAAPEPGANTPDTRRQAATLATSPHTTAHRAAAANPPTAAPATATASTDRPRHAR
ncbi:hypothetical protein [Streptomyces sp. LS1784]|uniref:hypothetical protein n=1 Tax=Streptomyces sp. LS1784 TaxID=2851533 RepID=UPI001CCABBC8|nr:hypothetical protein [Streptomyces sp. LS1784]